MHLIDLAVLGLATYRAASIIAQEDIFKPLRDWLSRERVVHHAEVLRQIEQLQGQPQFQEQVRRLWEDAARWDVVPQPRRWAGQLISCVFCVSVWAGWVLLAVWLHGGIVGQVAVGGLAASGAAVSLGTWLANSSKRGE